MAHVLWERRLRRAEVLEQEWPFAAEILRFFQSVTLFQRETYERVASGQDLTPKGLEGYRLAPFLLGLLEVVEREGPPALVARAAELRSCGDRDWDKLLWAWWKSANDDDDPLIRFFPQAILQPCALWEASLPPLENAPPPGPGGACPICKSPPLISVLREDKQAETVRRTLVCSLCSTEWDFPRVLCPNCREERHEKLPRYTAQEISWVRVEACDSCRKYLKAVDLTKCPDAEPVVDELASTPLDVIARERGYSKIAANLAGV